MENQFSQNDIVLNNVAAPEVDEDDNTVAALLHEICTKFPDMKSVRETHESVQELLSITCCNSWEAFIDEYNDEVKDYWKAETVAHPDIPVTAANVRLIRAQKQYETAKQKVQATEQALEHARHTIATLEHAIEEAKVTINEAAVLTWDAEAKPRAEKAQQMLCKAEPKLLAVQKQAKALADQLPGHISIERRVKGRIIAAERINHAPMLYINTGSPKDDAWLVNRIADSVAFKIATQEAQIHKSELQASHQRFEDPLMENGSGGIYESAIERLKTVQDEMDNAYALLACCEWEYETIAEHGNNDPTKWFPEWTDWGIRINKSRTSLYNSAMKRSAADRAAFAAIKQRV